MIGDRTIGDSQPLFLIAETGTTHLGEIDAALALVDAAAAAGMDAVKFQMIDPDQDSDASVEYGFQSLGRSYSANMAEMFRRLHFSDGDWRRLANRARDKGLIFFATADYFAAIDLLRELRAPAIKLGAWDSTYAPLIRRAAETGLPVFLDLGPTSEAELSAYRELHEAAGGGPLLLFHDYHTADPAEFNLRAITALQGMVEWPVGYSSPGLDDDIDLVAIGLGARFLEKRLILSRATHAFHADQSMEPAELSRWVARMRRADAALGTARIVPSAADRADALKYYRSVCTLRPVRAGEELTIDNVAGKRPGTGMPTMLLDQVWGRRAVRDLAANTLLREGDFA